MVTLYHMQSQQEPFQSGESTDNTNKIIKSGQYRLIALQEPICKSFMYNNVQVLKTEAVTVMMTEPSELDWLQVYDMTH